MLHQYIRQLFYSNGNLNIDQLLFIHHHRLSRGRLNIVCPLSPLMRELGFGHAAVGKEREREIRDMRKR